MYFKFIALTLAFVVLGRAASIPESSVKGSTVQVVSVEDVSKLSSPTAAHAPSVVSGGKFPTPEGLSTTSPNLAFHALASEVIEGLIICTGQQCSGSCYTYDLAYLYTNTCYAGQVLFLSAEVYSPYGNAIPYGFYVTAQDGCGSPAQLPFVNTCYNLFYNGLPTYFRDFYVTN